MKNFKKQIFATIIALSMVSTIVQGSTENIPTAPKVVNVNHLSTSVYQNTFYEFPKTVNITLSDNTSKDVDVV